MILSRSAYNPGALAYRFLLRAVCILLFSTVFGCADKKPGPTSTVQRDQPTASPDSAPRPPQSEATIPSLRLSRPAPVPPTSVTPPRDRRPQFFWGATRSNDDRVGSGALPASGEGAGEVTLNFVNADIREVIQAVLGDVLHVDYTIDPKVQGLVTIQTTQALTRSAVLPVLESTLRLHNVALVVTDKLINVVPIADALRQAPLVSGGLSGGTFGFAVQIVPLRFMSSEEMQAILKSIVPGETSIRSVPSRNILIFTGSQRELQNLTELVATFDINRRGETSFALFPVDHADAKVVLKELEVIFGTDKTGGPGQVRFLLVERLNSILAISQTRDYLREAANWVDRLDEEIASADERIFIYYLQNTRSVDVAATLNALFSRPEPARVAFRPAARDLDVADSAPVTMPPPSVIPGLPPTFPQRGSPPLPLERIPSGPGALGDGIRVGGEKTPRIIADETNNALLILATPRSYKSIEDALLKIDLVPLQVLIEASVAEVTLTNELRYGLQWFFQVGSTSATLTQTATSAIAPDFPGFAVFTSTSNIRAVLSALESRTRVNVLSAPQLMVLNNQTATLQVGDQVPIATQSATSVLVPGAPIVNTIQFKDTGVILRVTPRVNEGGLVTLDINQEVSDVVPTTTSGIDSPTIQQRKINSTVSVNSGETIALGGLIRDRNRKGNTGIPVLKDIPILGELFKSNDSLETRTELVVLITPRVVRTQTDIRSVTSEYQMRQDTFQTP